MRKVSLPLRMDIIRTFRKGEEVLLTGGILTARDAAHKRLYNTLLKGKDVPIDIRGQTLYYTGPTPARRGEIIGSCGPTTSARMDPFTVLLLQHGLLGMIGKGERSLDVIRAIKRYGAVYFITIGGAGAYLSQKVISSQIVAYEDLGPEAIFKLEIEDFPVVVWEV